jgi:Fe-S-cluster containining protein
MYDADNRVPGLDFSETPELKPQLECFCCGICCHYRVFISMEEAQRISSDQKIELEDFLDFVNEHNYFGQEDFLIKQRDGFCVFLDGKEGTKGKFCRIHHIKPQVCCAWVSTYHRPECQQGLALTWRLTIDDSTNTINGPEEQLQKFNEFMKKLTGESK